MNSSSRYNLPDIKFISSSSGVIAFTAEETAVHRTSEASRYVDELRQKAASQILRLG